MEPVAIPTNYACLTRLGRFLTKVEQPFLLGRAVSSLKLAWSHIILLTANLTHGTKKLKLAL